MKTCCRCGQSKPDSEYHKDCTRKDGLHSACKQCLCAARRAYYKEHRAKQVTASKLYNAANRAERLAYCKAYREANRAKVAASKKAYREAHRSEVAASRKTYNKAHRAEMMAYTKRWAQDHPEQYAAARKRGFALRRAREVGADGAYTARQWSDLKARYGHTCLCCGRKEPEIQLTPDHVIPLARGGSNGIENIQPLCLDCNVRKHAKTIDYRPGWQVLGVVWPEQLPLFTEGQP